MKLMTVVFGILLPFYAASEPKELFCAKEWGAKDVNGSEFSTREAYLERLPEDVAKYKKLEQEMIADYGYDSNLAQSYRDLKNNTIGEMELCKTSPWFDSYSFLFDTNGLKNATESDVEMGIQRYCGAKKEDIRRVKMKSTPSLISFVWTGEDGWNNSFNVDRKTLKAGMDTNRQYNCELKDIDMSDNLL